MNQPPDLKELREKITDARTRICRYGRTRRRNAREKRKLNQIKRESQTLGATTISQEPCQEPLPSLSPCNTQPKISDKDEVEQRYDVERRYDHCRPNAMERRQYDLERRVHDLEHLVREMESRIYDMERSKVVGQRRYDSSYM